MKNPRTRVLLKLTGNTKSIRLLEADRGFLRDLARLGILDSEIASKHHYRHLKNGGDRSLNRLESAGLIQRKKIVRNDHVYQTYTFANPAVARAWGGKIPVIGSRRMEFHEMITSRLFYALGKPDDFRIASRFSREDTFICGEQLPDAMYTTDDGEVIFVESDSGHYSQTQILHKQRHWSHFKQVWGQPNKPSFTIRPSERIAVIQVGGVS